jgi:hypothetical protein
MCYIEELTKYSDKPDSENRLSQIFSATFNNSEIFKKIFFKIIDYKYEVLEKYNSQTQISYFDDNSRFDICIYDKDENISILIENKIESALTTNQLKKYDKIDNIKKSLKLAIVRYYFDEIDFEGWKILHWSDLYREITDSLDDYKINDVDLFIIKQFLSHLEMLNMYVLPKIDKSDFKDFCDALVEIRNNQKLSFSLKSKNIFSTGETIIKYFEEIVEMSRKDADFVNSIGKNYQFNPIIDWWSPDLEIKEPVYNFSLSANIYLAKVYKNIQTLGIGLMIDCTKSKKHMFSIYSQTKDGAIKKEHLYESNDIIFDDLAKITINKWKKYLNI